MRNKDERQRQEFIEAYNDKINELVNQDMVRGETLRREIEAGVTDQLMENAIALGIKSYHDALNAGFDSDQAFAISMRYMFGE